MRLTLRTLLSYLDDTLPPSEAKAMGAKLAESEPAQDIVERIKNVIRRRRLTVPPPTNRIDPNTLGEYLDNEITPELAEELERICLASDVHLAEVAACHQILSLVLGEPAAAPEAAVKRMYGIAKGEGVKSGAPRADAGKAPKRPAAGEPDALDREADETLRMGLPSFFGKNRANRWMMVAGGLLASLLLVVAVMQLVRKPEPMIDVGPKNDQVAVVDPAKDEKKVPDVVAPVKPMPPVEDKKAVEPKVEPRVEPKVEPKVTPPATDPKVDDLPPPAFSSTPDKSVEAAISKIAYGPPNPKVSAVGKLLEPAKGQIAVVVQQIPKTTDWKRLVPLQTDVLTNRPLVSLPGSKAEIVTSKGVKVTLWGNIPEHIPAPLLQESVVELYEQDGLDLDMTHHRGRILLTNLRDEPSLVRVRFENPSEPGGPETYWIMTLAGKNAEALIDRWTIMPPGEPFFKSKDDPERKGPIANVACIALAGTVFLKSPTDSVTLQPDPKVNLAIWMSTQKKLFTIVQALPAWLDPKAPTPPEFLKVRGEVNSSFTGKAVDVAIAELMKSNDLLTRRTAVRDIGAIDDLAAVYDALSVDKIDQRVAGIETLIHWIALSRDNDYKVYDLVRQKLKPNEADAFMTLLHGFSQPAASRPETYEMLIEFLKHNQIAIREAAAWNLYHMVPAGQAIPYDASDPAGREKGYQAWRKLIPPGKLPPAPKTKASLTPHDGEPSRGRVTPRRELSPIPRLEAPLTIMASRKGLFEAAPEEAPNPPPSAA